MDLQQLIGQAFLDSSFPLPHSSPEQQSHDRIRRAAVEHENWMVAAFTTVNVFGLSQNIDELLVTAAWAARSRQGNRVFL